MYPKYIFKNAPVTRDGLLTSLPALSRELLRELNNKYMRAKPFKHVIVDNAFPDAFIKNLISYFESGIQEGHAEDNYFGVQELKRRFHPDAISDEAGRLSLSIFSSKDFLNFLEGVTGIDGLIPDPYLEGGGFHETAPNGFLGVHVDFRIHEKLSLVRRLNVILYLNEFWESKHGGAICLYDSSGKIKQAEYLPVCNRLLIFETTATSFHGHPDKVSADSPGNRKSVALYYYTSAGEAYDFESRKTTVYVRHGESRNIRFAIFKLGLKNSLREILPPFIWRLVHKTYFWLR